MPDVHANGIDIYYEEDGSPSDEAVVLIPGLGGQLHYWPPEIVDHVVRRGFRVIRPDNRDAGYSERLEGRKVSVTRIYERLLRGESVEVPYLLSDMAADTVGLLDALGIEAAHVVGVSMGGMIAQTIAARHPERTRSLISIMSTTGSPEVGQATPEMRAALFTPPPLDREAAIRASVESSRLSWGDFFDEERARATAVMNLDRGVYPEGTGRQLAAVFASGDRTSELATITAPTLVIHGEKDPLIDLSGGIATAKAIPGAELMILDGAGHDLPPVHRPSVAERAVDLFRST